MGCVVGLIMNVASSLDEWIRWYCLSGSENYRWPNGPCQMGRMKNDTKNTTRTRPDTVGLVSVPARHDRSVVRGAKPQHAVPARARHD